MSLDPATVRRIAKLARIGVNDADLVSFQKDLNGILTWVEQLDEINVDDVPPMVGTEDATLRMREDKVTDGDCVEDVLSNAPRRQGNFYAVPKVVE